MNNLQSPEMLKMIGATLPKFYNITGGFPTPQPWLPETAVDGYRVTHQPIDRMFPLKLIRGGFLRFDTPLTLSVLFDPSGEIWMSDSPSEIIDALNLLPLLPDGHILMGGVGIGLVPWLVYHNRPDIEHMTLVDINPVAYQLAKPRLDEIADRVTLVTGDFREYLIHADLAQFDGVFMDIWATLDYDLTLLDMMSLWQRCGLDGAIWGADLCVKGLADILRLATPTTALEKLEGMGLADVAQYIRDHPDGLPDEQWFDTCYPLMIEAATAVYDYPFLNLDEELSSMLR